MNTQAHYENELEKLKERAEELDNQLTSGEYLKNTQTKRGKGLRFDDEKDKFSCIPLKLIRGAARILYKVTIRKTNPYPMWNWAAGMLWSKPYDCLMRHMDDWYCGEDIDPDTGESHLDHALCNLLFLIHYRDAYKEGDDRPKEFFKKED